jgi:hypothetical protein
MEQPADTGVSEEGLDEALAESFPASDPLSFWSGRDDRRGRPVPETVPETETETETEARTGPGGTERGPGLGEASGVGEGRGPRG